MAGVRGKSGPPGNMNAFKHGLAAIQKRRDESITTEYEEGGQAANSRRLDDWIERRNGHVAQDWAELTRLYSQA